MARAASPEVTGSVRARAPSPDVSGSVRGRITVCARMRPLLESELAKGIDRAPWVLTDTTLGVRDRFVGRAPDSRESDSSTTKTRSEVRTLDHLKRDGSETVMDAVFGGEATTQEVYERSFREIVAGASEGLNGAILAYGQTSSGKTYSISGSRGGGDDEDMPVVPSEKGIIHFALDDLFAQIHAKASNTPEEGGGGREYLVRMSYCELYMERVNDLLRKISPQSQNLQVKEDAETRSFYVEGIKEKIVSSPAEVHSLLIQAEKRRRVAYTRFNEVSSRSHTLLTLHIECSMPLDVADGTPAEDLDELARVTKVGRLTIVDLAGNERIEVGTEYMAESTSINKSLFFLGKVIEKLSARERAECDGPEGMRSEQHVPFRDSKLTRLLSVHLGGNSQTGVLVTLTPHFEYIEQSMMSLRFAQKAATIRTTAKPVLVSKEQSLIMKQREIISQLHQQVLELRGAQGKQVQQPATPRGAATAGAQSDVSLERQQRVEQLQALTLGPGTPTGGQTFVSKSREVDTIVTALHRTNETLRQQKGTVLEEFKALHKTVTELSQETKQIAADMQGASSFTSVFRDCFPDAPETGRQAKAWEPAVQDLRCQLRALLQATYNQALALPTLGPSLASSSQQQASTKHSPRRSQEAIASAPTPSKQAPPDNSAVIDKLREENMRLRASVKHLSGERERLKTELNAKSAGTGECVSMDQPRNSGNQTAPEPSCKRSDGTGSSKPISSSLGRDSERLRSPSRKLNKDGTAPQSPEVSTRPPTSHSGRRSLIDDIRDPKDLDGRSTPIPGDLYDFEPIVERGVSQESLRHSGGRLLGRLENSLADFDVEPIVTPLSPATIAPRPPPLVGRGKSPMPPPRPPAPGVPDLAPRLTQDYFRQVGVRTSWRPGDTAYWRGQECKVVRVVGEDQPLYVVLLKPDGAEVTTDLCLLSDGPPGAQMAALRPSVDTAETGRPLRLAPLGAGLADLCLDRPLTFDRAATPDRAVLTEQHIANAKALLEEVAGPTKSAQDLHASSPDKCVARSASLPARGLSPVRAPSRQSAASRMRCNSPLQNQPAG